MLRAFNRIAAFTWQGAGFDAWLYGIARNVVQEAHRHSGRRLLQCRSGGRRDHGGRAA